MRRTFIVLVLLAGFAAGAAEVTNATSAAFGFCPSGAAAAAADSVTFGYIAAGLSATASDSPSFGYVAPGRSATQASSAAFGYVAPGGIAAVGSSSSFGYAVPGAVLSESSSANFGYVLPGVTVAEASSDPFAFGETTADMILRVAFDGIGEVSRTEEGYRVTLTNDFTGTITLPDNLGLVEIDLAGHDLKGGAGTAGTTTTPGENGTPALVITVSGQDGAATKLVFSDSDPDADADIVGGTGGAGSPPGNGGPGIRIEPGVKDGVSVEIGTDVTLSGGKGGEDMSGQGRPGDDGKPVEGGEATGGGTIVKAVVPVPEIDSKTYNGLAQIADVASAVRYAVTANAGGTDAGVYPVVLTLTDAVNCRWPDSDVAGTNLTFAIVPRTGIVVTVVGHSDECEFDNAEHAVSGWDFSCADSLYQKSFVKCSMSASASGRAVGTYPMGLTSAAFSNLSDNFAGVTFNVTDGVLTIVEPSAPVSLFRYEPIGTDKARILGFVSAGQKIGRLVLPSTIAGRTVTEIADGAFANSASGMTEVVLPKGCTVIGDKAFYTVASLTNVTFSSSAAVTVGAYAFAGTALRQVVLPACVVSVGNYAFANCRHLSKVTILGKPTMGTMPFRRAGMDVGGVIVHLDPALAGDAAYMSSVKQGIPSVTVRTDALVTDIQTASVAISPTKVSLKLTIGRASEWGRVDVSAVRVKYQKSLGDKPEVLVPEAVVDSGDGTVTVEVRPPDGSSGFFRATYEKGVPK